jgi:hypothetical protein
MLSHAALFSVWLWSYGVGICLNFIMTYVNHTLHVDIKPWHMLLATSLFTILFAIGVRQQLFVPLEIVHIGMILLFVFEYLLVDLYRGYSFDDALACCYVLSVYGCM